LLSVNVLSNSISTDFSFYNCVYSVLTQLSRIIANNGDSHKSSMQQNVYACILEVNSTRIGIKLPVDICVMCKAGVTNLYVTESYFLGTK